MDSILTPQSICQLDTFTLEQKIEELDSHPQKEIYAQIIRMAKLELIDRLEIQQFGRQLANDQYKIDLEFNLPTIETKVMAPVKPPPSSGFNPGLNRKQFLSKLQLNLVSVGSFLTVGRPAVNHHYKPKHKQLEPVEKPKSFLKAKKSSFSKPKPKITPKIKTKTSIVKLPEKQEIKTSYPIQQKKVSTVKEQKPEEKPQFSLKQKLKKQVEQMKVEYRENDAYDDMKVLKMSPLNLKEEEAKIMQTEKQKQFTAEHHQQQLEDERKTIGNLSQFELPDPISNISSHNKLVEEQKYEKSVKLQKKIPEKIFQDSIIQEEQVRKFDPRSDRTKEPIENSSKVQNTPQKKKETILENEKEMDHFNKLNPSITTIGSIEFKHSGTNKQIKSKSVKNFNTKIFHHIKSDADHCQIISTKIRDSASANNNNESQLMKLMKREEKNIKVQTIKTRKSGYEHTFKPLTSIRSTMNQFFPYHQIIPSFQKLFPHSQNFLITLRNVEESLKLHFERNVSLKSLTDECRRVDSQELTFKIISESQKARKYRDLFNIEIDSFYERNKLMLTRLKNELDDPEPHEMLFYRVVRTKEEVYDIINSSFHRTADWFQLPHGLQLKTSWNLLWTWSRPQIDFTDLFYFQKVNHFLGNKQIARKDLLKKNIQKMQKLGNKMRQFFDLIPQTFLLPGENIQFIKKFRENGLKDSHNYWILKPVGLSRGRGISLINKLEDVVFSEPIVLQKYIMNPLLIDGFKFDMRIYVLVTSINPLEAFLYQQGFARMSTELYSIDQQKMENKFVHLTNFSIQRQNLSEEQKQSMEANVGGSKISLKMLARKLQAINIEWSVVEKQIEDIILKSLIASMNTIPQNPNCFQLFGYDIFIDSNLKCWLLQINSSPSLQKEYTLDQIIKQQLVDDIVQIVNPINYDRSRLLEVVERRRKETQGLKSAINTHSNSVQQLDEDLDYILHGQKLRRYGESIRSGNFKMIAPSENYHRIIKILQQYKIDPIIKQP